MSHVIYRRNIKTNASAILKTNPRELTEANAIALAFVLNQKNKERADYVYGYCQESLIGSLADKLQEATHA